MDRGDHELFGRCVHIVNRIPLFIGEGIKFYLCVDVFLKKKKILATYPYILGKTDAACIYFVLLVYVQQRSLPVARLSLLFFFPVFTVSVPHEQTVFPPELMESNLIVLHFLPTWLQFGANSKHYTYSILCL